MGLVRGAVSHYCLGGCSALVLCARRSRPLRGAGAGAGCRVFPVFPVPPRVPRAVCGGSSRPGISFPRSLVRHSMRSVRSSGSVWLPFWYSPRVLCVCVCARALAASAPPPLPGLVWRAHPAWSRCWAQVGPSHDVCAPPRVLHWTCAVSGLLWGGWGGPVSPLPGLGQCAPRGVGLRVSGVPAPGGGLGWVRSRPHPDLRDHGRRPSLRVTTGPVGARLSGRKACRTDDRPRAPRWHAREGFAAVPVCMGRAGCCACGAGAGGAARHAGGWGGVGGAACAPHPRARSSSLPFQRQVMMVEFRNQAGARTGVTLQAPLT